MRKQVRYCCSFCASIFWTAEECKEHEEAEHKCNHCRNLCIYYKNIDEGTIECDCEAHNFHRSSWCEYYVEGEPNMEYCIEEKNLDFL